MYVLKHGLYGYETVLITLTKKHEIANHFCVERDDLYFWVKFDPGTWKWSGQGGQKFHGYQRLKTKYDPRSATNDANRRGKH